MNRRTSERGSARRAGRARRARGFTFLELMAVVTIMGLLSAIVVANLDGLTDRSTLNASARALGNTVLGVRDMATLQGRTSLVEIDVGNQRWRTVDPPSAADVPDPDDRREQTVFGSWYEIPEGVVLDSLEFSRSDVERRGIVEIAFDADGQLTPAGFVAYFRHEAIDEDDGVSLEVTGLTGLVDYARGRRRSEEVRDEDDF